MYIHASDIHEVEPRKGFLYNSLQAALSIKQAA